MIFFSGLHNAPDVYGSDTWVYDFGKSGSYKWMTVQDADARLPPMKVQLAAAWDNIGKAMYLQGVSASTPGFWKLTLNTNKISVDCFGTQPVIFGKNGNDSLVEGTAGIDVIFSSAGDDSIKGGSASDYLCGGTGNDIIQGEDGDDYLKGDAGNDTLTGGLGKDHFDCGDGNDSVTDYDPSQDTKAANCE
jgi:Ca2+-binding RTX toxin-like protein